MTVVVGGEALVDLVPHQAGELRAHVGGGPYNTARTLGRLEQDVHYLGCLSHDGFDALDAVGHRGRHGDDVRRVAGDGDGDVGQRHVRAQQAGLVARGQQQVARHVEADRVALALGREQQDAATDTLAPGAARHALQGEHAQRDLRREVLVGDA